MPQYQLSQIKMMATPNFEPAFEVEGLAFVPFDYPRRIAVAVGYHFGLVRASLHGGEDHYEAVFELYENGLISKDVFRYRIEHLLQERKETEEEPAALCGTESRRAHQSQSGSPQGRFRDVIERIVVGDDSCRIAERLFGSVAESKP